MNVTAIQRHFPLHLQLVTEGQHGNTDPAAIAVY